MTDQRSICYERIVSAEEIQQLKNLGLNVNGIIAFADDIMDRYFNGGYLDIKAVTGYNDE